MKYTQPQFGYDCADFEGVDNRQYWFPIILLIILVVLLILNNL